MMLGVTDFSQTVISAATAKDIDIAAVIHSYYLYLLLVCPLAGFGLVRLGRCLPQGVSGALSRWMAARWRIPGLCGLLLFLSFVWMAAEAGGDSWALLYAVLFYGSAAILLWRSSAADFADRLRYVLLWAGGLMVLAPAASILLPAAASDAGSSPPAMAVILALTILMAVRAPAWSTPEGGARWQGRLVPGLLGTAFFLLGAAALYFLRCGDQVPSAVLLLAYPAAWLAWRWRMRRTSDGTEGIYYFLLAGTVILTNALRIIPPDNGVDFFEIANQGLAIYGFLTGTSMPVFQNFDAHMFSVTGWGILYGWLNGDVQGAWLNAAAYFAIVLAAEGSVCFVCRKFLSWEAVCFLLLFLPMPFFLNDTYLTGVLLAIYLLAWMRRSGMGLDIGFAVCLILSALDRLDIGAAWGVAFELTAVIFLAQRGRRGRLLRFLAVQLGVGALFVAGVCCLGSALGLDGAAWLRDFHAVIASNQHWGSADWGEPALAIPVYFLLPIAAAAIFLGRRAQIPRPWDTAQGMLLIFWFLAWLLNAQRLLVRHTLHEGYPLTYGALLLLLLLFLAWTDRRGRRPWLEIVLVAMVFFCASSGEAKSFLPDALANLVHDGQSIGTPQAAVPRPNDQRQAVIDDLDALFRAETAPQETYLDFTDQTLLYAYLGKKNVAYVNQLPAMLNGREAQIGYLARIEAQEAPYALLPFDRGPETAQHGYNSLTSIDGIQNTDRFYLIAEYIGTHYEPCARIGDFAIWCRKDRAGRAPLPAAAEPLASYGYAVDSYYRHELGWVPCIWAEHGVLPAGGQPLALDEERVADLAAAGAGGILLELDAAERGRAGLAVETLGPRTAGKTANISFRLKKGTHRYYLRLSSDFLWYAGPQHRLHLQLPEGVTVQSITWLPAGGEEESK